jgi:hypothetical protein
VVLLPGAALAGAIAEIVMEVVDFKVGTIAAGTVATIDGTIDGMIDGMIDGATAGMADIAGIAGMEVVRGTVVMIAIVGMAGATTVAADMGTVVDTVTADAMTVAGTGMSGIASTTGIATMTAGGMLATATNIEIRSANASRTMTSPHQWPQPRRPRHRVVATTRREKSEPPDGMECFKGMKAENYTDCLLAAGQGGIAARLEHIDNVHSTRGDNLPLLHNVNFIRHNVIQQPLVVRNHED